LKAVTAKSSRASGAVQGSAWGQVSAQTDGMCKGTTPKGGSGPIKMSDRGGKEYAQVSAQTSGLCK
jgi:hypothetical protein